MPSDKKHIAWAPQLGPQTFLCQCPHTEIFFGGARGGGKTDGVLGMWALMDRRYGANFNAIMFRRTAVSAEDAIERSREIYAPLGGRFNESKLRWRMPNGGRVSFAYLENTADANIYQGRNVSHAWVEEAGQYPTPAPIDRLFGILRSAHGVPIQIVLTANPGGPGQHWIRQRYQIHPFPKAPIILTRTLSNGATHRVAVIPSRITDNKILLANDPTYVDRLHMVGSPQLVRAWLEGDWSAIEGAFFTEWDENRHVVTPFAIPSTWLRFRSADWGSYSPFSIGWWAVATDDHALEESAVRSRNMDMLGTELLRSRENESAIAAELSAAGNVRTIPRGALVRYREWYGEVGGKLTAEQVAEGIVVREQKDRQPLTYGVLDPSAFIESGGPSIAESINRILVMAKPSLVPFRKADNKRVARNIGDPAKSGPMGGWDAMRARLLGRDGVPMLFCFDSCKDSIRTIPVLQHDGVKLEDVDTDAEDHCFTGDTLVSTDKGVYSFIDLIGTEGHVLSHDGLWHRFRSVRLVKHNQPIMRLTFNDGSTVRCTPDHDFLTTDGWIQARDLRGRLILSLSRKPPKSSKDENIISAASISELRENYCIAKSGRQIADLFHQSSRSITSMPIARITRSIISIVFRSSIINPGFMARSMESAAENISNGPLSRQKFGTPVRKAWTGIKNISKLMLSQFGFVPEFLFVSTAGKNIAPIVTEENFVPTTVRRRGDEKLGWMMNSGSAQSVKNYSAPIASKRSKRARENVGPFPALVSGLVCYKIDPIGYEDVYCFTVPDTGNFALPNGVITSQCADEWRYACMSRPWVRSMPVPERPRDSYRPAQEERNDSDSVLLL